MNDKQHIKNPQIKINENNDTEYKILIDALKYTSDIIITLTDKISIQEDKIYNLEQIMDDQIKLHNKNDKIILELNNKLKNINKIEKKLYNYVENKSKFESNDEESSQIEESSDNRNYRKDELKNIVTKDYIKDTVRYDTNLDFEIITQTMKDLTDKMNEVTDISLVNPKEIEQIKKERTNILVDTLLKQKINLDKKLNDLTLDNKINNHGKNNINFQKIDTINEKAVNTTQEILINRRRNNFVRKF